ncbi:MAG: MBL fold metallo-hydrolase [Planctomycetota bacterium]
MTHPDRREFLQRSASCSSWLLGLFAVSPLAARRAFAESAEAKIVAKEKWGRLEELGEGVWSLVSTPFETRDFTTVSNGGIIAGTDRVLVVEAFNQPAGAKWLAEKARELTGRWPTDVVVTHFHSDHSAGSAGFTTDQAATKLWLTDETRSRIEKQNRAMPRPAKMLEDIGSIATDEPVKLDLGERTVTIASHEGHTDSDVTIEVSDENLVFCGDLFFNKLIPNYSDAKPRALKKTVAGLRRDEKTRYVPGHGAIASPTDLELYREFLAMMEESVRAAHQKGLGIKEAAAQFRLPKAFADWYIFSPQVVPRAFNAWYAEFDKKEPA